MAGRRGDPSPVPRGGCLLTEQSPSLLVGGRILDAGAVASWTAGELAIQSWLAVAPGLGLTFLLPELAVTEARTLRPHADAMVEELVTHPHIVLSRMSSRATLPYLGTFLCLRASRDHRCRRALAR
ncbi:MAG: hypothetical protein ACRDQ4_23320 [Pseudonocardiaceae bacterium]